MKTLYSSLFILLIAIQVSAQDSDKLILLQAKADNYYNQGNYSNSIIVFEDLLAEQETTYGKDDIRVGETLNRLGEMYSIMGMPDIADYYFQQAILIFKNSFQSEKNALEIPLLNLLKIYSYQNDSLGMQIVEKQLHSISTIFQSPNNIYPEFPLEEDILFSPEEDMAFDKMNLGLSYMEHGLYSEAAIQFNEALDNRTDNLDLQFLMDFFPDDSTLAQNMTDAFSFQIDYDTTGASYFYLALFNSSKNEAYGFIQSYIYNQPSDLRGLLLYSNLLFENGEHFDALFQYQKVLWLNPQNLDAQIGVGLCLYHLGEFRDAASALRRSLKIDPYNHISYHYLGLSLMADENFREAIPNLTQSLLLDPENSDTYYNLGKSYFESGKIIQAREAFNRTININPQYGPAFYYLGLINENIMEIEKAVNAYSQAWEYSPEIEDVHYRLGMLLYRTGQLKQAMEPLRRFIITQPDSIHVLRAMGEIFISN